MRALPSDNIPLGPGESAEDLTNLDSTWTNEIPGNSYLIQTLRSDLIRADWFRRRARTVLNNLQVDLNDTGLPRHYWNRFTQHQMRFLEKYVTQTQNEFRKALRFLLNIKPPATPAKPDALPSAPPKPQRDYRADLRQNIRVTVKDGKTITKSDVTPQKFLEPDFRALVGVVTRLFWFEDAIVPEEYAYALEHRGVQYLPTKSITINYTPEDFEAICRREIATAAEHLLDGKRSGYLHQPDLPLKELPKS